MLIIFEGSDFSGKSSIADRVEARLQAFDIQVRRSRTNLVRGPFSAMAWMANAMPRESEFFKSLAFHAAYLEDMLFWRKPHDIVVIQESYALRVLARDIVDKRMFGLRFMRILLPRLPQPDLAYFFECSFDERKRRYMCMGLRNRRDSERFGEYSCKHKAYSTQLRALVELASYRLIDTSELDADDSSVLIAEEIVSCLKVPRKYEDQSTR